MADDAPLLFDVTRLVWRRWKGLRPTGIDRLCLAWLHHYGPCAQAVLVDRRGRRILPPGTSKALFGLLGDAAGEADAAALARFRRRLLALGLARSPGLLRSQPGRGRLWLNVGHTGLDQPGLAQWCRAVEVRPMLMVHDLIPLTHPQYCRAGEDARHRQRITTLLSIAHGVLVNSQHTLAVTRAFAAAEGLPMPPAAIAWTGVEPWFSSGVPAPPTDDFVILGTIEGRKNHMLLLDVWQRLVAASGAAAPRLVIIGRRGWACDDVLARLDAGGFGDRVVETGPIDDAAITRHLRAARALLFPSFAEGYGLPLVEGLAAGVPVIASDLDVFLEIGQGVPDLLPPQDLDAWEAAILDYARPDSPRRAAQMARFSGFRTPDWPSHFAVVDRFLASLG